MSFYWGFRALRGASSEEVCFTSLPAFAESSISADSFFLSKSQSLRWIAIWFWTLDAPWKRSFHGERKKRETERSAPLLTQKAGETFSCASR